MSFVVRAARVGDLVAVVAMERAAETAPHWAEAAYAGMLVGDAGSGRERCLLVAELAEGEVVGFGVASLVGVTARAEVENLVVKEAARRVGVGRVICEGLMAWARGRNAAEIELEVRAGNVGARALYGRLGFVNVGKRRGYYGDGEDAVLMRTGLDWAVRG